MLLKLVKFQPKKINILSNLIDKGYNYEEIKEYIQSKKIDEQKEIIIKEQLMDRTHLLKIYFLLSFMPSGLPDSLIKLIFQEYDKIIVEEDKNNRLIYKDPENNWNYLTDCKKEINLIFADKKDEKKELITNCLKIYANLLFFYIEKNKQNIHNPDNDIHFIFNSYNGKGIWKTFDNEMHKYCFSEFSSKNKNEYEHIISYDFDLERHSKNIINLMIDNIKEIGDSLKKNNIIKEYIEQILIMLPSCYFLKKECKNIIRKCQKICNDLSLDRDEKRLLLFLYSLEENKEIDLNQFTINPELYLEAKFLFFLKKKDKNLFEQIIKDYKKKIVHAEEKNKKDIKLKIAECYYIMAEAYYVNPENNKELEKCKEYLIKAKIIAKEINDYFLMDIINIDLFFVSSKLKDNNHNIQNNEEKNKNNEIEFLNEVIHQKKYMFPYNKKLQSNIINKAYKLKSKLNEKNDSDIVLLNSNPLNNHLSVFGNSIFAYHNNQYYLLEQFNEKIKRSIKFESNVLNKENLQIALDKKGKILIIQSDDFSEKGEIILETENGESQILSIEDLKNLLPVKIKFDILTFLEFLLNF